jgi:nitrogen fixation-related uncharacterized protein
MSPSWTAILARLAGILDRLIHLWLAFKSGQWREQKNNANAVLDIKDEQNKIAAERPLDRDDLVRRLRERGF